MSLVDIDNLKLRAIYGPFSKLAVVTNINQLLELIYRYSSINSTESTFACDPMNYAWEELLYNNYCDDIQKGSFFMWGSAFIASIFLYFTILISLVALNILEGN